ncbi:porin [Granulicella paludicola]|uniref:porin n=1 Tax=Granulicella paludicola TaxID=474951 RepID=UPI0021E011C3|nr:porin [Granulicella paludicola]
MFSKKAMMMAALWMLTAPFAVAQSSSTSSSSDISSSNGPSASEPQADGQTAQTAAPTPAVPLDQSFFHRLGRAYAADWAGNGPGTAVPQEPRRGTPAPLPSPPYPASDWPIGGTVVVGAPDGQTYPLMQAIDANKDVNKIYGWIEVGANGSTNNKTNASKGIAANAPAAYDVYSNTVQLDQLALYFERLENTAQNDHFDWGYRVTALYGTDYRFTTSHGLLSQQLLVKNSQYGFDPVMFYFDMYLPHVGEGTVVRVGRYISLPDIEAQLAPNNYTYSHSILYTYDCYTQVGVNVTTKINRNWTVQGGLSASCDTMPWTTDAKPTGNVCVVFTWHNGGDALNTCDNTINDGKYAYNNLTAFYETWYHRISPTWHTDTEVWYQYMKDVPNMYWYNGGYAKTAAHPWPETNGAGVNLNFGAVCQDPRLAASKQSSTCFAPEWAITNYVEHNFWHNTASLNIRNEYVDDIKGQRTGTPAAYEEHMVGFDFWSGSTITFRPEVSYTKCYSKFTTLDGKPVSCTDISAGSSVASDTQEWQAGSPSAALATGRGKTSSLTVAADLIWHF